MLRVNQLIGFGRQTQIIYPEYVLDNFDDNTINTSLWTATNSADVTVSETSQQLRLTTDASYSGSSNAGFLLSVPNYNFTGRLIYSDVTPFSGTVSASNSFIVYDNGGGGSVSMVVESGRLYMNRYNGVSLSGTDIATPTFTKWKMQNVSADNTWQFFTFNAGTWALRFTSAAANWNPTACKIFIRCNIFGANATSKTYIIDNVITNAT